MSSRGWASLRSDPTSKCVFVDDDFELITFDFVTEPSTRGAYLAPVQKKYKRPVPDQSKVRERRLAGSEAQGDAGSTGGQKEGGARGQRPWAGRGDAQLVCGCVAKRLSSADGRAHIQYIVAMLPRAAVSDPELTFSSQVVAISHLGHGVVAMEKVSRVPGPAVLVQRVAELQVRRGGRDVA
mgnify:CR=1 FL=1